MAWYRSLPEYEQADEYSFYISDFKGGINMSEDDQNMSLSESPLAYNVSGKDGRGAKDTDAPISMRICLIEKF